MLRGDTIPEAFVAHVLHNPRDVLVADDLAGVLTGERLLTGALALSRRLRTVSGSNVGERSATRFASVHARSFWAVGCSA